MKNFTLITILASIVGCNGSSWPVVKSTRTPTIAAPIETPANTSTPRLTPRPTLPPVSTPTAAPTQGIPTPTQGVVQTFQSTNGTAIINLKNLDKLPLSPTSDNFAVGVITWETTGLDRTKPVIELSVRGVSPKICMSRPCKNDAGLIVRYSANLAYDDTLDWSTPEAEHESQKVALGQGLNYHRRLALGAKDVSITIKVTPTTVEVHTPIDSVIFSLLEGQMPAPNSMGMGRFIKGVPWPRKNGRSWLWNQFDGTKFGVEAVVEGWEAEGEQPPLVFYPAP